MSSDVDPHLNSLALRLEAGQASEELFKDIVDVLTKLNPSWFADKDVANLRIVLEATTQFPVPNFTITTLYACLKRFPEGILTPVHAVLAQFCCSVRNYSALSPLINEPIQHIPKNIHLRYQDHMVYHYYLGMGAAAMRDYKAALFYLSLVISVGGNSTSLIQVHAYKRFILLGLISDGEAPEMPSTTAQSTRRTLETLSVPYTDFIASYKKDDLQDVVQKYSEVYERDGTSALVRSAIFSIPIHKIMQLPKVYVTISVQEASKLTSLGVDATIATIQRLIDAKSLDARIADDGFIEFIKVVPSPKQVRANLALQYQRMLELQEQLIAAKHAEELDPETIARKEGYGKGKGRQRAPGISSTNRAFDMM